MQQLGNGMSGGSGHHGPGGGSSTDAAVGGGGPGRYGAMVPEGVYGMSLSVLGLGISVNGHGIVIPTGRPNNPVGVNVSVLGILGVPYGVIGGHELLVGSIEPPFPHPPLGVQQPSGQVSISMEYFPVLMIFCRHLL
jgi:hypothetical protein